MASADRPARPVSPRQRPGAGPARRPVSKTAAPRPGARLPGPARRPGLRRRAGRVTLPGAPPSLKCWRRQATRFRSQDHSGPAPRPPGLIEAGIAVGACFRVERPFRAVQRGRPGLFDGPARASLEPTRRPHDAGAIGRNCCALRGNAGIGFVRRHAPRRNRDNGPPSASAPACRPSFRHAGRRRRRRFRPPSGRPIPASSLSPFARPRCGPEDGQPGARRQSRRRPRRSRTSPDRARRPTSPVSAPGWPTRPAGADRPGLFHGPGPARQDRTLARTAPPRRAAPGSPVSKTSPRPRTLPDVARPRRPGSDQATRPPRASMASPHKPAPIA